MLILAQTPVQLLSPTSKKDLAHLMYLGGGGWGLTANKFASIELAVFPFR